MSHQSALLVSHGQPSDPAVGEAEITALAQAVGAALPDWTVLGATLATDGALERAIAEIPQALVSPMFMADGWFTQTVLPRRLGNGAFRILPPFGLDTGLPDLAARLVASVLEDRGGRADETALGVAGHGSGRSPRPADVTRAFADAVAARLPLATVRCGFVEEPPYLTEALAGLGDQAICLPFFAAKRGHVLEDIPEALETARFTGAALEPVGLHPDVPQMIADALTAASLKGA
jgi:sirohydrochlorin ferrochelatase